MHATHTVHALPDLRLAGGRWGDGFYHALQGLDCKDLKMSALTASPSSLVLPIASRATFPNDASAPERLWNGQSSIRGSLRIPEIGPHFSRINTELFHAVAQCASFHT